MRTGFGSRFTLEAGFRAPAVPSDAQTQVRYGVLADFNRFEAFEEDAWTARLMARISQKLDNSTSIQAFFGPSAVIVPDREVTPSYYYYYDYYYYFMPGGSAWKESDNQVLVDYGVRVSTNNRFVRLAATFAGRYWSTGLNHGLPERTVHQFGATAEFGDWPIRPGVSVRVPLDDNLCLASTLKYVYGVTLRVGLGDGE